MSLDDLKAERSAKKRLWTISYNFALQNVGEFLEQGAVEASRVKLIEQFKELTDVHKRITDKCNEDEDEKELQKAEDYYELERGKYVSLLERINDLLGYNNVEVERKVRELLTYETDGQPAQLQAVLSDVVDSVDRPKVFLDNYSGESNFYEFLRAYDLAMGKTEKYEYKLLMLAQCCKGPAKNAIQCCLQMSDSKLAYEKARSILKDKFGDPCRVAYSIVRDLCSGKQVSTAEEIKQFAADLDSALHSLTELDMLDNMISQPTIKEIALRLPENLCRAYQKKAVKAKRSGSCYPEFEVFCDFVSESADYYADSMYGEGFLTEKQNRMSCSSQRPVVSYSAQVSFQQGYKCIACNQHHLSYTFSCPQYMAMDDTDKLNLVMRKKACFLCLKHGHQSRDCKDEKVGKCSICLRNHSRTLHDALSNTDFFANSKAKKRCQGWGVSAYSASAEVTDSTDSTDSTDVVSRSTHLEKCAVASGHTLTAPTMSTITPSYMPVCKVLINGKEVTCGLDTCASNTLCTEQIASEVGALRSDNNVSYSLSTAMGTCNIVQETVSFTVQSLDRSETVQMKNVLTCAKIPIVHHPVHVEQYAHLRDINFTVRESLSEVDLLIGQDYCECLEPHLVFSGQRGEPWAIQTIFGAVLNGKGRLPSESVDSFVSSIHQEDKNHDADVLVVADGPDVQCAISSRASVVADVLPGALSCVRTRSSGYVSVMLYLATFLLLLPQALVAVIVNGVVFEGMKSKNVEGASFKFLFPSLAGKFRIHKEIVHAVFHSLVQRLVGLNNGHRSVESVPIVGDLVSLLYSYLKIVFMYCGFAVSVSSLSSRCVSLLCCAGMMLLCNFFVFWEMRNLAEKKAISVR